MVWQKDPFEGEIEQDSAYVLLEDHFGSELGELEQGLEEAFSSIVLDCESGEVNVDDSLSFIEEGFLSKLIVLSNGTRPDTEELKKWLEDPEVDFLSRTITEMVIRAEEGEDTQLPIVLNAYLRLLQQRVSMQVSQFRNDFAKQR